MTRIYQELLKFKRSINEAQDLIGKKEFGSALIKLQSAFGVKIKFYFELDLSKAAKSAKMNWREKEKALFFRLECLIRDIQAGHRKAGFLFFEKRFLPGVRNFLKKEKASFFEKTEPDDFFGEEFHDRDLAVIFLGESDFFAQRARYLNGIKNGAKFAKVGGQINRELGFLFGYPSCCVDDFMTKDAYLDRVFVRKIFKNTGRDFFWELNFFVSRLLTYHFPCSFGCQKSRVLARKRLKILNDKLPPLKEIKALAAAPVIFFTEDAYFSFFGKIKGNELKYEKFLPSSQISFSCSRGANGFFVNVLSQAFARGDRIVFSEKSLSVFAGQKLVAQIRGRRGDSYLVMNFK